MPPFSVPVCHQQTKAGVTPLLCAEMDNQAQYPKTPSAGLGNGNLLSASCPDLLDLDCSSSSDKAVATSSPKNNRVLIPMHILNPLSGLKFRRGKKNKQKVNLEGSVLVNSKYAPPTNSVHSAPRPNAMVKNRKKKSDLSRLQEGVDMSDSVGCPPVCILLTRSGEERVYQLEDKKEPRGLIDYHKLLGASMDKVGSCCLSVYPLFPNLQCNCSKGTTYHC